MGFSEKAERLLDLYKLDTSFNSKKQENQKKNRLNLINFEVGRNFHLTCHQKAVSESICSISTTWSYNCNSLMACSMRMFFFLNNISKNIQSKC